MEVFFIQKRSYPLQKEIYGLELPGFQVGTQVVEQGFLAQLAVEIKQLNVFLGKFLAEFKAGKLFFLQQQFYFHQFGGGK